MTAITRETDPLRELDADVKQAWKTYSERLHGLSGSEYEDAESACWTELQRELRRLERRRKLLSRTIS